jgi:hypothetical protein
VYLKEGKYHTRLFRGPITNGMKKWDGPSRSWPTPHTTPLFLPPKTPHWSYSNQTRSQDEEKNPPPKPYLPPQTRTRHRRGHRPHVPMHNTLSTPPITSDRKPTQPTTRHSWRGRTGVCVLLLQDLLQSCSRGGRRRVEDMCYERRRAEACVDESAHHALVNAGGRESNNVDPLVSGFGQIYLTVK